MNKKVILFSPVCLDHETLLLALKSHSKLKGLSDRWYFDDNSDRVSSLLLSGENQLNGLLSQTGTHSYRSEETHDWTNERVSRIASIRNLAIDEFLKTDSDYLFIIDSDIIVHPNLVEHLVSLDQPIVSEVFWSQWNPGDLYTPNVWDIHSYGHTSPDSVLRLKTSGLYPVNGLGACTLIHRSVFESGVRYEPVLGLDFKGEDRWFCIRAASKNIPMFADTTYPPFHVYRSSQLEEARVWSESGCDPEYFREVWLDENWESQIRQGFQPKTQKSIAICCPGEQFSALYLDAMVKLSIHLGPKAPYGFYGASSSNPAVTRDSILKMLKSNPHDYMLWVDDDNIITAEQFDLLLQVLENYPEIDAVAGWCMCASEFVDSRRKTSCGQFNSDGYGVSLSLDELQRAEGLIKIDWSGFPCLLMRSSLISKLGYHPFAPILDPRPEGTGFFGEDISFFKRAQSAGAIVVCDPRVKVPHLKLRDANIPTTPTTVGNSIEVREV